MFCIAVHFEDRRARLGVREALTVRLLLESTLALDCKFNVGHLVGVIARKTSSCRAGVVWMLDVEVQKLGYPEFWSFGLGILVGGSNLCGGSKATALHISHALVDQALRRTTFSERMRHTARSATYLLAN